MLCMMPHAVKVYLKNVAKHSQRMAQNHKDRVDNNKKLLEEATMLSPPARPHCLPSCYPPHVLILHCYSSVPG